MHIIDLAYYKSACELGLPAEVLEAIYGFQINLGGCFYFFSYGVTPFNDGATKNVIDNKLFVNKFLEEAGFPVAKAVGITKQEFENNNWSIEDLKFPLVIKPVAGTCCGKDVLCNIKNKVALQYHLTEKFKEYSSLLVEEFHDDLISFRVLVFYGKIIGIVKRVPAQIIGDGQHSIAELITIENEKRQPLKEILPCGDLKIDEESKIILDELKLTPEDIPAQGRIIKLCYACNSTRGGSIVSVGQQICKENSALIIKAARILNLNLVGFDLLCEDINIPIKQSRGIIVEANYHPNINIHEVPMVGIGKQVSKVIMRKVVFQHPVSYIIELLKQKVQLLNVHLNIFNDNRISVKQSKF